MHFSVTYDRGFKLLKTFLLPRCRSCDCIYLSLRSMNLISHCYFRHKNCNLTENPSNTLQTAANANILQGIFKISIHFTQLFSICIRARKYLSCSPSWFPYTYLLFNSCIQCYKCANVFTFYDWLPYFARLLIGT